MAAVLEAAGWRRGCAELEAERDRLAGEVARLRAGIGDLIDKEYSPYFYGTADGRALAERLRQVAKEG